MSDIFNFVCVISAFAAGFAGMFAGWCELSPKDKALIKMRKRRYRMPDFEYDYYINDKTIHINIHHLTAKTQKMVEEKYESFFIPVFPAGQNGWIIYLGKTTKEMVEKLAPADLAGVLEYAIDHDKVIVYLTNDGFILDLPVYDDETSGEYVVVFDTFHKESICIKTPKGKRTAVLCDYLKDRLKSAKSITVTTIGIKEQHPEYAPYVQYQTELDFIHDALKMAGGDSVRDRGREEKGLMVMQMTEMIEKTLSILGPKDPKLSKEIIAAYCVDTARAPYDKSFGLETYMSYPYHLIVTQEADDKYMAKYDELICMGWGSTPKAAITDLIKNKREYFETKIASELQIPEPAYDQEYCHIRVHSQLWDHCFGDLQNDDSN